MYNENNVLKKYVSKLEKNLGVEDQMNNLRSLLAEKDQLLVNLSHQIKEYQSKCDNIIIGKTEESKDKQIQLLLNEVKGIRKRILSIITLNKLIDQKLFLYFYLCFYLLIVLYNLLPQQIHQN